MKVLHCCFRYFPDRGGSETYVSSLIRELKAFGVENIIASAGAPCETYQHDGVTVHRLGHPRPSDGKSECPPDGGFTDFPKQLGKLIDTIKPDVLHMHWHPGDIADLLHDTVKCPVVLTFHHPSLTCIRGDLLHFGSVPCSGVFGRDLCLPCVINERGVPKALAPVLGLLPDAVCGALASIAPAGKMRTAIGMGPVLTNRMTRTRRFLHAFQRIFVLSEWSRKMLVSCGVAENRVQLSRLGTHHASPPSIPHESTAKARSVVRGIFVGRLDSVKGVHVLAAGMSQIPDEPVEIDVYGPLEGADPRLASHIEAAKHPGAKLRFMGALKDSEVVNTMLNYDFAVVCSQFLETGPYTVIEALQAGLPVLGTDIGGINEMVVHGVNGWLVPMHASGQWAEALKMIARDPSLLDKWASKATWGRTMKDVATEVADAYKSVVQAGVANAD